MPTSKRTTIYVKQKLLRALKIKAALTDRALSDLVNEAVASSLAEDALDAEAIRKRAKEPSRPFAAVLRDLKKDRLI